jgi:hemerythrin
MGEKKLLEPIVWKDEYKVHVGVIDDHHKKFVDILNNLQKVLEKAPCAENISEVFFSLLNYAEHHLLQEEIYFKNYKYPGFQQHKDAHKSFLDRIAQFQEDYAAKRENVCLDLYRFLKQWFKEHILMYDREAVKFLVEKGFSE